MGVGEPEIGVFISISTSESSSSLAGGVLCTKVTVLSRTSWIGQRLDPCPYLRYLKYTINEQSLLDVERDIPSLKRGLQD